MKLSPRTFKIEWDLHAWSGVIASLFLFVIFYCGMFALFNEPLGVWQDPSLHKAESEPAEGTRSFEQLLGALRQKQNIPTGARVDIWKRGDAHVTHEPTKLDADVNLGTGAVNDTPKPDEEKIAHSRLAEELYVMHFFYRVPLGTEFSGFVALAFFIALVSGVVIHLKDLTRQFWQFRPQLRIRFSSSDAHKVLGVFGLPFATMYAWSGALLGMYYIVAAPLVYGVYGGDRDALERSFSGARVAAAPAHEPATAQPLDLLVKSAISTLQARLHEQKPPEPYSISLDHYGDVNAALAVNFLPTHLFDGQKTVYCNAVTGQVQEITGAPNTFGDRMNAVLFDLHYARFGGFLVRGLYALLALAVCAVILTGNLIWVERRDARRAHAGNRWLERISVSFSFALMLGSAAYFAANRALPAGISLRANIEYGVFLAVWGLGTIAALSARLTVRGWAMQYSRATALTFALVVLADLFTQRAHLFSALRLGMPKVLVIEVLLLSLATANAALAWQLRVRSTRA